MVPFIVPLDSKSYMYECASFHQIKSGNELYLLYTSLLFMCLKDIIDKCVNKPIENESTSKILQYIRKDLRRAHLVFPELKFALTF